MDGMVNGKDLKQAVSLDSDVFLSGPLSFHAISANNLITKDHISGIDFDHWIENSLRSTSSMPQIVTANWRIKNLSADLITSQHGINGFDANSFASQLDNANRQLYEHYQETCNRVKNYVQDSQNNVQYLSHFEFAFELHHSQHINSIYLFESSELNYVVVNFGCITTLYFWNQNADRYDRLADIYTGKVNEWIHINDLRGILNLVSLGYETNEQSGCQISGANIWQHNQNKQSIDLIVKFANAGELSALQIKPSSRAHFYALRIVDNHIIEYNLNGAPVNELKTNVEMNQQTIRFLPYDADLGLAITNGEILAFITNDDVQHRKREIPCNIVDKTILNLERAFNDYEIAKKVVLTSSCTNCSNADTMNVKKFEQLEAKINETDSKIVPLAKMLLEFLNNNDDDENKSTKCNDSDQNENLTDPEVGSILDRFQDVLVDEMDTFSYLLTGNRRENHYHDDDDLVHRIENHQHEKSNLLERLINRPKNKHLFQRLNNDDDDFLPLNLLSSPQKNFSIDNNVTNIVNKAEQVGDKFGDLLYKLTPIADQIIDKFIKYYRKHKKNKNQNNEDVGDKFGSIEEKLTPIADIVTDKIIDYIRKHERFIEESGSDNAYQIENDDQIVGELFSNIQDKIKYDLQKHKDKFHDDETVGAVHNDEFNKKVSPITDEIIQKVIEKLDERRTDDTNENGKFLITIHAMNKTKIRHIRTNEENLPIEMAKLKTEFNIDMNSTKSNSSENDSNLQLSWKDGIHKFTDAVVRVYDFGKHVYHAAKALEQTYDEDEENDNVNYGASDRSDSTKNNKQMHEKFDSRAKNRNDAHNDDDDEDNNGFNFSATPTMVPSKTSTQMQTMRNRNFPSQTNDEVVAVRVGPNRKTLVIVSATRKNVIKGDHDSIQVSLFV